MIASALFAVFALGLRHGADPDHLAAIDNVTRNAYVRHPLFSRWVGTLFASGHAIMVLAISLLVGLIGQRFAAHSATIEAIGGWISVGVLLLIGVANVRALQRGDARPAGVRTRLLPRAMRDSSSVWLAIPIGLLFGFGFETSSQVATYAVAFGADRGPAGAFFVGLAFCAGMIVTDTLDCLVVHRLVAYRGSAIPQVMRAWIVGVTALAFAVAAYEIAQLLGWSSPVPDIAVSAALCVALALVFASVFVRTRTSTTAVADLAPVTKGETP